ncbi:MAG: hypothetical protein ABR527_00380, partial [Gemmatimonadota bacterium]
MTVSSAGLLRKAYWSAFTLWHARGEERLPYRPLDEIAGLQARRVRAIVAHAYDQVPHYREVMDREALHPRDFRTADDLARLPIVTGEDLARAPERFLSRDRHRRGGITIRSSGTSGMAKRIDYDAAALFLTMAQGHRRRVILARFVGRKYGYREMSATRSGSVDLQVRAFYATHFWAPGKIEFQRSLLSPRHSFEENVAQLNALRPDLLSGYGTWSPWAVRACPCGRSLPTLDRIEGRSDDLVALPGGEVAHSRVIMEGLQAVAAVVQVQLVQEELRRFKLLGVGNSRVDRARIGRELDAAPRRVLGEDLSLELEWVDAIPPGPGGKVRAVVSHVEQTRQSSTIDRFS